MNFGFWPRGLSTPTPVYMSALANDPQRSTMLCLRYRHPRGTERRIKQLCLRHDDHPSFACKLKVRNRHPRKDLADELALRVPYMHAIAAARIDSSHRVAVDACKHMLVAAYILRVKRAYHLGRAATRMQRSCGSPMSRLVSHRTGSYTVSGGSLTSGCQNLHRRRVAEVESIVNLTHSRVCDVGIVAGWRKGEACEGIVSLLPQRHLRGYGERTVWQHKPVCNYGQSASPVVVAVHRVAQSCGRSEGLQLSVLGIGEIDFSGRRVDSNVIQ